MLDIKPDFTDLAHRRRHQRALARSQSKGSAAAHSELEKRDPMVRRWQTRGSVAISQRW